MKKNHIRFDWAAKKMLRDKKNFDILEGFLSELLKEDIKIEGFLGSQANQEEIYENFNTVDVYAENAKGEHIIIEIHNTKELDYLMHMLCGNSKAITDYLIVGAPYSEVKKVIAVNIIDFGLGKGDDYIYVGQTEFTGLHSEKQLKLTKTQIELLKKPTLQKTYAEYYLIQTRRFKDVINKPLDEWIYFFKHNEVLEGFKAKGMNAVREKLIVDDLSLEDRKKYHAFLDNLHTEANIAQTVRMEQKEKIKEKVEDALKKQKNDIVNQLMKINMSDDQIIKITGLSEKKLSQTRAKMLSTTKDIEAANEEIQSLNEELKTSKDELQSSNEQLIIINQELLDTQEELNTSHSEKVEARKKTEDSENQQKKLASQLKLATDSAQVGIWSLDIASSKLEWSDLHKKMWGYDEHRQDLTYEDWHKVIVPEDKELAFQRVEESRVNHSKYEVDYRIKRANDGVIVWMKSTGQYYYDAFGVAHTLTGISLDITEQVKARNIIQESKAHLQKERQLLHNLFNQAPALLAILKGPEHVYEFANPAYREFVGNQYELIGKTVDEALPGVAEQGFIELLDNVYNTGEAFNIKEMPVMLDKGNGIVQQFYANINYQALTDEKGETEGILVFAYDVTQQVKARKQIELSETKFRTLSDTIPNMVWAATPDGQKNFFNKYFLDYTGLPLQKLQGDGIKSIIFPADLEEYLQLWKQSLETAEDFMMEKRMRHHDGTYRWHISHGIAQKDTLDNVIGWIGSNTEIEKQKIFTEELEAKVKERTTELQVSIEQLKQSNSQLDQFAYIVSHDLQEPLRKILTFSMLLKDKQKAALNQEVIAYLTKIEGASKRMRTLIEDLLNYSRLLQYEKMFEQTNLNQTLKNIVNDFELLIQEKKGDIKFNEFPIIEAIPLQMNQLFYNLIGNALKFSKQDIAPVISITARMLSRKEIEKYPAFNPLMPYVEIIFKDHGIGFDQQYAERIFIIFQRLHGRETFKGTGIGLALCKKITENHHGEIFANAEENEGAAFHVILPLTQSRQTITNKPLKD